MNEAPQIFHITSSDAWRAALAAGSYSAPSLAAEGFIHCSTAAQVERTYARFFRGLHDLVILTIDTAKLDSALRYDPADGELFPHVYGPISVGAVAAVQPITLAPGERFRFQPPS